jgi:PAS domain S-box-containing protein
MDLFVGKESPATTAALELPEPVDERRRPRQSELPKDILEQLSADVVLEQLMAPVLAVGHDGTVVFANVAFADMVGHSREAVMSLRFHEILPAASRNKSAVAVMKAHSDQVVELCHQDGSSVRAEMSGSALLRGDDPLAVVIFHDVTEHLWTAGKY